MIEVGQVRRRPGYCKFIVAEEMQATHIDGHLSHWGWTILCETGDRIFVSSEWLEQTEIL